MGSNPHRMAAIFQPCTAKKTIKAPSIRVGEICRDHRLLWRDFHKGVERALTLDKSTSIQFCEKNVEQNSESIISQWFVWPIEFDWVHEFQFSIQVLSSNFSLSVAIKIANQKVLIRIYNKPF